MTLTQQQRASLLVSIQAAPEALTLYQEGNLQGLADYYNAPASPAFIVWRTSVSLDEIMGNGFDWVLVDNLSVGKARIWDWLFANERRVINPSKPNVRAGIAECWKGTAAMLAQQAVVLAHCKRAATRFERVFATGTGSDVDPGLATVVGPVDYATFIGLET